MKKLRAVVTRLKDTYPVGTKVILMEMNDPYRDMPRGLKGVVTGVDDMATIHVNWENGSTLGVAYGEDRIKKEEK